MLLPLRHPVLLFSAAALAGAVGLVAMPALGWAAEPWPEMPPPVNIAASATLPGNQHVSGAAWNPLEERLYVVDDNTGCITSMDREGKGVRSWTVFGRKTDAEALTFASFAVPVVYLGIERGPRGPAIRQYQLGSQGRAVLQQEWTLSEMKGDNDNAGLEGLAFIPDECLSQFPGPGGAPYQGGHGSQFGSGGLFFASLQATGAIYVYDLDLSGKDGRKVLVGQFPPVRGRSDLSELSFDRVSGLLYCLWDKPNRLAAFRLPTVAQPVGQLVREWHLWKGGRGRSDEGLAVASPRDGQGPSQLFLCDDRGEFIWRFTPWPAPVATP